MLVLCEKPIIFLNVFHFNFHINLNKIIISSLKELIISNMGSTTHYSSSQDHDLKDIVTYI
jgi:hypothetical protein